MAILKPYPTPHGVTASYHKVQSAEIDAQTRTVKMRVLMYASAEAREAGAIPIWEKDQTVPFSAFTQDPRGLLYPMLTHFGDSFLKDGLADEDSNSIPGDFSINLKPEALEPTPPYVYVPYKAPQSMVYGPDPTTMQLPVPMSEEEIAQAVSMPEAPDAPDA